MLKKLPFLKWKSYKTEGNVKRYITKLSGNRLHTKSKKKEMQEAVLQNFYFINFLF